MSNYLGRCRQCDYALFADGDKITDAGGWYDVTAGAAPKRVGNYGVYGRCKDNHKVFRLEPIKGKFSEKHECDARCLNAKGHNCTCSCGGINHGRGYAVEVVEAPEAPEVAPVSHEATDKQIAFILTLLDEREISEEKLEHTLSLLDAGISKHDATRWIDRLLMLPKASAHV
jgi:hypothetical protein